MRQVSAFMTAIHKAELVRFYTSMLSYGTIHGAKLPSLNEFLGSNLKEAQAPAFDKKTDEVLEAEALKRLEEKRRQLGK